VLSVQIMAFGQGYAASTQSTTNLGNSPTSTTGGGGLNGATGCTIIIGSTGSVYSGYAAGGILINVTGVTSSGGISTVALAGSIGCGTPLGGSGYSTGAQSLYPSAAGAVFNAEVQSTYY